MAKEGVKTILSPKQLDFFKLFSEENFLTSKFYLTGGTALAEFYLKHRYSEDLDFFNEEEFSILPIRAFVQKAGAKLGAEKIDYQNVMGLHTFFFWFSGSEKLKVDFNYYPFPRILKGLKYGKISIDSDYDIAVNKVHTIVMQPRARDFIDVYFLIREKKYEFKDLQLKAKAKFDWHIDACQLGARLLEAQNMKDFPTMLKKINHSEWQDFFLAEARKLAKKIF